MRVADLDRDMSDVIPTGTSRDAEFLFGRMERATLDALGARPGLRILDQAGGLGQDSRTLAGRGAVVVCAEPSRRMLDLARLIEPPESGEGETGRVSWTRSWSELLPFRSGSFDAAFCKGALDHFDDPERSIAELARVTKADGRVVVAVANFESLGCKLQRLLDRVAPRAVPSGRRPYHVPSDHFTRYEPTLLRAQLERHLVIEQWRGLSLLWGFRPWSTLLSRLPAAMAHRLLRLADRLASLLPSTADVLLVTAHPRRS